MKNGVIGLAASLVLAGCMMKPAVVPEEKLTVVAVIVAKEAKTELVKTELTKLIEITRAEEGCINYDLHQDNKHPTHFLFFENWTSEEMLQQHLANQHLQDYMAATDGAVAEFTILKLTEIDPDLTQAGSGGEREGLTVVAKITAKPDQVEFVKAELRKLIPPSRAEMGCINYDMHQDNENPAVFVFYENWKSRGEWLAHMDAPHLKGFLEATDGALAEVIISDMTPIE